MLGTKFLLEYNGGNKHSADEKQNYSPAKLLPKIQKEFGDRVVIRATNGLHNKRIVYRSTNDVDQYFNQADIEENSEQMDFENVAYKIRNEILKIKKKKLPDNIRVTDILEGECETPQVLTDFIRNLVQGPDVRRKTSGNDNFRINSVCQDLIYIVTNGRVKPSKHLMLGLAMKSLTSSRKVVTILNRLGHSTGYCVTEEMETELTYCAHKTDPLIPPGIVAAPGRGTHVMHNL